MGQQLRMRLKRQRRIGWIKRQKKAINSKAKPAAVKAEAPAKPPEVK